MTKLTWWLIVLWVLAILIATVHCETLGREEVRGAVLYGVPGVRYAHVDDKNYLVVPESQFVKIALQYEAGRYRREVWDCEDRALDFLVFFRAEWSKTHNTPAAVGFMSGKIGGRPHAQIFFLDDNGGLNYWDPARRQFTPESGIESVGLLFL